MVLFRAPLTSSPIPQVRAPIAAPTRAPVGPLAQAPARAPPATAPPKLARSWSITTNFCPAIRATCSPTIEEMTGPREMLAKACMAPVPRTALSVVVSAKADIPHPSPPKLTVPPIVVLTTSCATSWFTAAIIAFRAAARVDPVLIICRYSEFSFNSSSILVVFFLFFQKFRIIIWRSLFASIPHWWK